MRKLSNRSAVFCSRRSRHVAPWQWCTVNGMCSISCLRARWARNSRGEFGWGGERNWNRWLLSSYEETCLAFGWKAPVADVFKILLLRETLNTFVGKFLKLQTGCFQIFCSDAFKASVGKMLASIRKLSKLVSGSFQCLCQEAFKACVRKFSKLVSGSFQSFWR